MTDSEVKALGFLADDELRRAVEEGWVTDVAKAAATDWRGAGSQVQAASIDLYPRAFFSHDSEGGQESISLRPGGAVLIETRETFHLPADVMGLVFTPTSWSLKGFFSTSVGHIDPGFNKPLTIVGINMGRQTLELDCSQKIAQVLLYRLQKGSSSSHAQRGKPDRARPGIIINRFASDFGDFRNQAKKVAREVASDHVLRLVPALLIGAGVALFLQFAANTFLASSSGYNDLNRRVAELQGKVAMLERGQRVPAPADLNERR